MPHLRTRALRREHVVELSKGLFDELAELIETPRDNFTLECETTIFIADEQPIESYPIVEILWFERPSEIKKKVADYLTRRLREITKSNDVVVYFHSLEKTHYFENGEHF